MDEPTWQEYTERNPLDPDQAAAFFRWSFPPAMAFAFAAALTPTLFWGLLH